MKAWPSPKRPSPLAALVNKSKDRTATTKNMALSRLWTRLLWYQSDNLPRYISSDCDGPNFSSFFTTCLSCLHMAGQDKKFKRIWYQVNQLYNHGPVFDPILHLPSFFWRTPRLFIIDRGGRPL